MNRRGLGTPRTWMLWLFWGLVCAAPFGAAHGQALPYARAQKVALPAQRPLLQPPATGQHSSVLQRPMAPAAQPAAGEPRQTAYQAALDAFHARVAQDYAPRVRFHPNERYGLGNVKHFFSKFHLVLSTPLQKLKFDVDENTIAQVTHNGWMRRYTTTDPAWKDHWSFESKDGCEWSTKSAACDAAYLRAADPVAAYQKVVVPEVYYRVTERMAGGRPYLVVQYFFLLLLNDAQNKHDGEWESSVVVVDRAAYLAAGADYRRKRAAIAQLLMAGHYRHEPFNADFLRKYENSIFVPGSAHFRHVMSLGGHGGYLVVPRDGKHEASMQCFEFIRASAKKVDSWAPGGARLVRVDERTPWIRYVGRWGRRYGLFDALPLDINFSFKPVGVCEGAFGLGWLKSRVQVVISAPFGPMFIHQNAWHWRDFPASPAETPKHWR